MTKDEFIFATAKGQGRAITALRAGDFQPSFHDVRRLVLRWPGFDFQCESSRGWYTVELIKACDFEAELTDLVIRHLPRTKGARCHWRHREAVVLELARRGVSTAKDAIYANFDPSAELRFGEDIVELDGIAGLDWVISHSDGFLLPEQIWQFKMWVEDLGEAIGVESVSEWLVHESASRPEVAEFARLVAREWPKYRKPDVTPVTFATFREQWQIATGRRPLGLSWLISATEDEIKIAWRAFEVEDEPEWLRRLALILKRKPKHCDIDKVIERARNWKLKPNPFAMVLEEITDPRVRQFGLDLIGSGLLAEGIGILATNAAPGDESLLLASAQLLADPDEIHWSGMDLIRLGNELDSRDMMIWICETTPCSFCRESALRRLIEQGQGLESLLRECLLDCDPETRELAEGALR